MDIIRQAIANQSRVALATATSTSRCARSTTLRLSTLVMPSYGALLHRAASIATDLLRNPLVGVTDARPGVSVGARVAFLLPPGPDYVAATWAAWLTGSTAVPLCTDHPPECACTHTCTHTTPRHHPHRQLQYVVDDCTPAVVIANPDTHDQAA